jgi:hypothetical protein
MNRVTKERVEAARLKNEGIKLNPGSWARSYNGIQCMCALSHVAMAEVETVSFSDIWDLKNDTELIVTEIAEVLGLTVDYVAGYTLGFDGSTVKIDEDTPEDFKTGYEDGQSAIELVTQQMTGRMSL